jgi:hypothetical protein
MGVLQPDLLDLRPGTTSFFVMTASQFASPRVRVRVRRTIRPVKTTAGSVIGMIERRLPERPTDALFSTRSRCWTPWASKGSRSPGTIPRIYGSVSPQH